ncbi:hypothetical protein L0N33_22780, partial [Roseburia faecis]|nr:hypothetical protein [Roseburia faecis]
MTLVFPAPDKGLDGPCRLGYKQDYLVQNLEAIESPFLCSVSARLPLGWDAQVLKSRGLFQDL